MTIRQYYHSCSYISINELILPCGSEGEIAKLAGLRVLDGRVADIGLVEVEAAAAQQALVVHLASGVLVTSVKFIKPSKFYTIS